MKKNFKEEKSVYDYDVLGFGSNAKMIIMSNGVFELNLPSGEFKIILVNEH